MKLLVLILSFGVFNSLLGLTPITENFRFTDRTFTYSETTPAGRKIEETKHFHVNEGSSWVSERTEIVTDGVEAVRERAWWFTDEVKQNHFRIALLSNGNLQVTAMAPVSSGYEGVGMNENERGWYNATQMNFNTVRYGRLRISSGALIGRGQVNDTMYFRKTWNRSDLDREGFEKVYRSAEYNSIELADEMKFLEPMLGRWEGSNSTGRHHTNGFYMLSSLWVLEFWNIDGEEEDGLRGINIIGTDTLSGGISRSAFGPWGFSRFAGHYVDVSPNTMIQFQGNSHLIRKVSGDTMNVTWKSLEGTEFVEEESYDLKKAEQQ